MLQPLTFSMCVRSFAWQLLGIQMSHQHLEAQPRSRYAHVHMCATPLVSTHPNAFWGHRPGYMSKYVKLVLHVEGSLSLPYAHQKLRLQQNVTTATAMYH